MLSARKVFVTGLSLFLSSGAAALAGVVTARALGPSGKGIVAGVMAWPQLCAWILLLGLGTATSLRVAEAPDAKVGSSLGNAVGYCCTVGLVGAGLGVLLLPSALDHLGPEADRAARFAVLLIPISMLGEVVAGINLAVGRVRRYNTARVAGGLSTLVLSVALVLLDAATPITVIAAMFAGGLISLALTAHGLPWGRIAFAMNQLRADLRYGLRVFLTSLLGLVNQRIDILIMSAFLGATSIGWYAVAVNAMMPLSVINTAAASLIMPAIGRERGRRSGDSGTDVALIRRVALRYCGLTAAMAVALAVAIPWLVPILFGKAFEPAVELAWILLPGAVASGYAYIVDSGLVGMRRPWVGNASQGIGVVLTAILLPLLVPPLGVTGAAITSSVAYTSTAIVAVWALGRVQRSTDESEAGDVLSSPIPPPARAA